MAGQAAHLTSVEIFQNQYELEQLLAIYDRVRPRRVLEIGAWHGGTLRHWLRPGTAVVVIDDEMRQADLWQQWAHQAGATLHLLQGHSQSPEIAAAAFTLGPFEWVFVDGDHSYDAVCSDRDYYLPMVAEGGVIVFHDIIERPGYGVSRVWQELRAEPGARWLEVGQTVEPENESRCGIGVLWRD